MDNDKIRNILNILFMIGALASVIIYVFFYVCGASLFLKMVEFVFRFLL